MECGEGEMDCVGGVKHIWSVSAALHDARTGDQRHIVIELVRDQLGVGTTGCAEHRKDATDKQNRERPCAQKRHRQHLSRNVASCYRERQAEKTPNTREKEVSDDLHVFSRRDEELPPMCSGEEVILHARRTVTHSTSEIGSDKVVPKEKEKPGKPGKRRKASKAGKALSFFSL